MFYHKDPNYFRSTLLITTNTIIAYVIAYKLIAPWIIEIGSVRRLMFSVASFTIIYSLVVILLFAVGILNLPFPFNAFDYTITFMLGLLLVIGMTIYVAALALYMVINTLSLTLESYELLENSYKKELEVLKLQISPHFISNALLNLKQHIRQQDKERSIVYCQELLQLITKQLNGNTISGIPLFEELNLLERYLQMEQRRLNNNFSYEISVENEELDELLIPPMLLQPIIENSILHGFNPEVFKSKGLLKISIIKKNSGDIIILIEDNGLGKKADSNKIHEGRDSISTENIKKRINLINELGIHFIQKKTLLHNNGATIELSISQPIP
jgi:LytS/YehU family sensor histidine kinase